MDIKAEAKFVQISPKKVHPWLAGLRRKPVVLALDSLRYAQSKAGKMLYKLIHSAAANATNNYNFKIDNLKIKSLVVDEGPRIKRYWFRSHGSADIKLKRYAHLRVILEEIIPVKVEKKAATLPITPISPKADATKLGSPTNLTSEHGKTELSRPKNKLSGKKLFTRTTNK